MPGLRLGRPVRLWLRLRLRSPSGRWRRLWLRSWSRLRSCRGQGVAARQAKLAAGLVRGAAPRTRDHVKNSRARAMPRPLARPSDGSIPGLVLLPISRRSPSPPISSIGSILQPLRGALGTGFIGTKPQISVRKRRARPANGCAAIRAWRALRSLGEQRRRRPNGRDAVELSGLFRLGCGRLCPTSRASSTAGRAARRRARRPRAARYAANSAGTCAPRRC